MLYYAAFKTALLELKEIHEKNMQLSDILNTGVIEYTSGLENALLSVLQDACHDTEDYIGWWLYESCTKIVTLKNGTALDLTEPIALYNFLAMEEQNDC